MVEPTALLLALVRTLVLALGLAIAVLSYRAYRRTGATYLRFAAIGFAIIAFGVFLEGVLFELLGWDLMTVHILESVVVAIGFGVLLYSLIR